ncbi:unnamed protein product [Hymenolepis diminuta]|uniref:Zf-Tim10_DDP domain-containing protein n=1 Tax=Hymenolepis diminuta TaxID=6216 RepID=A0A0R3SWR1_HYMDI|nr:unnamed protein product [Hymenolepis diminuta]
MIHKNYVLENELESNGGSQCVTERPELESCIDIVQCLLQLDIQFNPNLADCLKACYENTQTGHVVDPILETLAKPAINSIVEFITDPIIDTVNDPTVDLTTDEPIVHPTVDSTTDPVIDQPVDSITEPVTAPNFETPINPTSETSESLTDSKVQFTS